MPRIKFFNAKVGLDPEKNALTNTNVLMGVLTVTPMMNALTVATITAAKLTPVMASHAMLLLSTNGLQVNTDFTGLNDERL